MGLDILAISKLRLMTPEVKAALDRLPELSTDDEPADPVLVSWATITPAELPAVTATVAMVSARFS
jgi:hypothetical protein